MVFVLWKCIQDNLNIHLLCFTVVGVGGMGGIESILLISDDLQKMMIMLAYFYLNKYQTNDQMYLYL